MAGRPGGCLCGAIRYEAGGEPQFSLQCHCKDCQKSSGTAFVVAMRLPSAEFRITRGTPSRYVTKSDAGNEVTRYFCGECGSPIYIQVSTRPDIIGLRVGTLDDPSRFKPEANIFVKSAQPWVELSPVIAKHDTYPAGRSYNG